MDMETLLLSTSTTALGSSVPRQARQSIATVSSALPESTSRGVTESKDRGSPTLTTQETLNSAATETIRVWTQRVSPGMASGTTEATAQTELSSSVLSSSVLNTSPVNAKTEKGEATSRDLPSSFPLTEVAPGDVLTLGTSTATTDVSSISPRALTSSSRHTASNLSESVDIT
ncbi:hypothetical protein AAY473_018955 [Plecturocebus cupreus]